MKKYQIAVVNGDGIGHEIVPMAEQVLQAVAAKHDFSVESTTFPFGAGYYLEHGDFMAPDGLEILKGFDAILFGAVGLPAVDDTLPFKLFTNKVRTAFKQYVNYRPVKLLDGVKSPLGTKTQKDIDFVVVRENNEGEFVQNGRQMYPDEPFGFATDTSLFTRVGVERIAHYSFKLARKRRKKVTNVTKSNTMINTLAYWDRVIGEVAEQYPDVEYHKMYIDAATANFVLHPEYFDVVLTTNMLGDILSDLGGAIMGSLGFGPSGNLNPENTFPSMFEPIHGSAPDIAGRGVANPIGQIWSVAIMLDHLGEEQAATAIVKAINRTTAAGILTKDVGGSYSTQDIARAIIENL
ncbi:tartrate dehydrogenase/decarboxylase/D-malate dehydrogenase [Dyadobacter jejuensis]|uniref:Tartrate dehydrogenase/decarboxylase/D-malate dehydrogenase n=1 Tax=Dyadobacter jejuensis TaxID=1082580 RepID=A0A316AGE9_9BACT|nr:isocitrate/isopropylmalate family dehydrogenase [Dyadobacter jejuensis]PWJ56866.1 tartrate dehydrogenase/decarboxylase/D-malate dehydrogenase [Dyadobacter jejuensis]